MKTTLLHLITDPQHFIQGETIEEQHKFFWLMESLTPVLSLVAKRQGLIDYPDIQLQMVDFSVQQGFLVLKFFGNPINHCSLLDVTMEQVHLSYKSKGYRLRVNFLDKALRFYIALSPDINYIEELRKQPHNQGDYECIPQPTFPVDRITNYWRKQST